MKNSIAISGGSGALGSGLALRWAAAGYPVIIGSRDLARAESAASSIGARIAESGTETVSLQAMDNVAAAQAGDCVVLTVPFSHHHSILESIRKALAGKILIDVTVPLVPPKVGTAVVPPAGSAAAGAQALLGDDVRVVSALQNVPATSLQAEGPVDCDVLVCGDDRDARETVIGMLADAGMRGLHAGPVANSVASETLTSVLITINRQFKCHAAIRITGLPEEE